MDRTSPTLKTEFPADENVCFYLDTYGTKGREEVNNFYRAFKFFYWYCKEVRLFQ